MTETAAATAAPSAKATEASASAASAAAPTPLDEQPAVSTNTDSGGGGEGSSKSSPGLSPSTWKPNAAAAEWTPSFGAAPVAAAPAPATAGEGGGGKEECADGEEAKQVMSCHVMEDEDDGRLCTRGNMEERRGEERSWCSFCFAARSPGDRWFIFFCVATEPQYFNMLCAFYLYVCVRPSLFKFGLVVEGYCCAYIRTYCCVD